MDHHDQDVLLGSGGEQPGPDRGFGRQVEGVGGGAGDGGVQFPGRDRFREGSCGRLVEVRDPLVVAAVRDGEAGAQRLVAAEDVAERGGQCGVVELPGQAQDDGGVVGRAAAFEPVEEEEPPLGEGPS
ncbi:hypothetical protein GTW66_08520 [Streptomyces sp. SID5473]|nr:hypothetical protein [Streptomyces tsukubensis NRRL18488]MYS64130.1 hypothetical protein [Streptomyces sp. SID5473]